MMNTNIRELLVNKGLIMVCLQNYREQLSLQTFLRYHSQSREGILPSLTKYTF